MKIDADPDMQDMEAIFAMLKRAEREGLSAEVVKSFGEERAAGRDVPEACAAALYEWDI